jgi:tyrosine-protein kinase Etk/Wzc
LSFLEKTDVNIEYMKAGMKKEDSLIIQIWNKFFPYWPLFVILVVISIVGAWTYLKYATPLYQASASILIKDENKGGDESKLTESLDYLSSKKIVENEIEVLRSKSLLKKVIKKLNLYASVYEEGKFKPQLAYGTTPVKIEYRNIDTLTRRKKIYFTYNEVSREVIINGKKIPTNEWFTTEIGVLRFIPNANYKKNNNPLFFTLTEVNDVVKNLSSKLNVATVSKLSSIVTLSVQDESPARAEDILKGVLAGYNEILANEKTNLASNTATFVDERLRNVEHDLDSIERKIQQYKSNRGAVDISTQGQLFLQNVSSNDQKLSDINMQLAVLKQVQDYVLSKNDAGGIVPSTLGVSDPLLTQLLNKLYDAELEYEKLKKTTAENNPVLVSVSDEINKIKPNILENIESQQKSLIASKNNLNSTNGAYSSQMHAIPQKEKELVEISREYSTKSSIYNFLLQKREESALSYSANTVNNRVVDDPLASPIPVSPKKGLVYLISIVVAFAMAAAIVIGKELLNRKILYRSEIESLTSSPIIAEIAFEKMNNPLVIFPGKRGLVAEQFRKLRASLNYMGINGEKKKILITSTISGEGKSFIAANLGLTLAIAGKKVVLLELDLSNPSLSNKLEVEEEKGLTSYLQGQTEPDYIIRRTEANSNLYIIPSGDLPHNPSELIMNGKVEELLAYLEDKFDYIIVDTAPVSALSDAYILSPLCDSTLYIVRHNHTPKAAMQRFDENNKINELKNVMILFNGVQPRGFSNSTYGYDQNYGYYDNNFKSKKTRLLDTKNA